MVWQVLEFLLVCQQVFYGLAGTGVPIGTSTGILLFGRFLSFYWYVNRYSMVWQVLEFLLVRHLVFYCLAGT